MRRDLAVAREAAGVPKPVTHASSAVQKETSPKRSSPYEGDGNAPQAKRVKLTHDESAKPDEASQPVANGEKNATPRGELDTSAKAVETARGEESATQPQPSTPPSAPEDSKDESAASSKPALPTPDETQDQPVESREVTVPSTEEAASEQKPSDATLQINTQPKDTNTAGENDQAPDSGKAPDTANTNNDFDSLFGGPTTSAPAGEADAPPDFDPNSLGDEVFDFGPPTADDNDNISALLPGLQDYANNQPGGTGDVDFDAIFNTDLGGKNAQQQGDEQGNAGFNEFLDYDFGADFGGDGEGGDGNGNAGTNQNANSNLVDFEFDFS